MSIKNEESDVTGLRRNSSQNPGSLVRRKMKAKVDQAQQLDEILHEGVDHHLDECWILCKQEETSQLYLAEQDEHTKLSIGELIAVKRGEGPKNLALVGKILSLKTWTPASRSEEDSTTGKVSMINVHWMKGKEGSTYTLDIGTMLPIMWVLKAGTKSVLETVIRDTMVLDGLNYVSFEDENDVETWILGGLRSDWRPVQEDLAAEDAESRLEVPKSSDHGDEEMSETEESLMDYPATTGDKGKGRALEANDEIPDSPQTTKRELHWDDQSVDCEPLGPPKKFPNLKDGGDLR